MHSLILHLDSCDDVFFIVRLVNKPELIIAINNDNSVKKFVLNKKLIA